MVAIVPFTQVRFQEQTEPGRIFERLLSGQYGDNFDIVASLGVDSGPGADFDPNPFLYPPPRFYDPELSIFLADAPLFTGLVEAGFNLTRGNLTKHAEDPSGTTDTNTFSGPVSDSIDHLPFDIDIYQLQNLHSFESFLLSTTPITINTTHHVDGGVGTTTQQFTEGVNPLSDAIGQYIEWKRIDKDTLAEDIVYTYVEAFETWTADSSIDYGGWRFALHDQPDQPLVVNVQDGLIVQRRFVVVGGWAYDGLSNLFVQNGPGVSTVPGPSITAPTPDYFYPVGLGQYTLVADSATPNLAPLIIDERTESRPGEVGVISGTAEGDVLVGTTAADKISGLAGNDIIEGGPEADQLDGGEGFDFATYLEAPSAVTASLKTPSLNRGDAAGDRYISIEGIAGSQFGDTIYGNDLVNLLIGGFGNDKVYGLGAADDLYGDEGSDTLVGGGGDDALFGGIGNDRLTGEGGKDSLVGGAGIDVLTGGEGRDTMTGGAGKDRFDFNTVSDSRTSGRDRITDFQRRVDDIDLSDIVLKRRAAEIRSSSLSAMIRFLELLASCICGRLEPRLSLRVMSTVMAALTLPSKSMEQLGCSPLILYCDDHSFLMT